MSKEALRVGIYKSPEIPQSFRVYASNVERHLAALGIEAIPFSDRKDLPTTADVLWDIRSGGGNPPLEFMMKGPPLVITVHGFAPITLSGWEYFRTVKGMLMSGRYSKEKMDRWKHLKDGVAGLIAVSNYTKTEAVQMTGIAADRIAVCHHGVDAGSFTHDPGISRDNYFLHVSNDEPRKNLPRIIDAFRQLRKSHDVELLLKLPADKAEKYSGMDGVKTICGLLSTEDLADLYRNALGFVFPSLYEGFGMPILEAMASGCPVITSNVSACPEVAGDAALIVDPRDEGVLFDAMRTLYQDKSTRDRLVEAGLQKIISFTWEKSADCHAKLFRKVAHD